MNTVKPKVYLVGETVLFEDQLDAFLEDIGAGDFESDATSDIEKLTEVMGRLCYRSFKPGLNKNVTKVREGNETYLRNVLESGHGSVLEHGALNFIFKDVSRVCCMELIRHRAGTAISQESLRYVRLDDISAYIPECIKKDPILHEMYCSFIADSEAHQKQLYDYIELDKETDFHVKKEITSAFRRVAPMGTATTIGWSCNIRELRHVIELRTHPSAEEEIRYLFSEVYSIVSERYANLFSDYECEPVNGISWVKPRNRKV